MKIIINGEPREVPPQINLQGLVHLLELHADRVAVELNREIVRRERWDEMALQENDRLEIVQFVGGG